MTMMSSRSLVLLLMLCLAEVALVNALQIDPLVNDIDIASCVAARKDKGSYLCALNCVDDSHYVQVPQSGIRPQRSPRPKQEACLYGFTVRPIKTPFKWEIEVKAPKSLAIHLDFFGDSGKLFILTSKPEKNSDGRRIFKEADKTNWEITKNKYEDVEIAYIIHPEFEKEIHYFRFNLSPKPGKEFASIKFIEAAVKDINNTLFPKRRLDTGENFRQPCADMPGIVLPRKPPVFDGRFRTKMPTVDFDRNEYDFAGMCPTNYRPFLVNRPTYWENLLGDWEIAAIECAERAVRKLVVVNRQEKTMKDDVVLPALIDETRDHNFVFIEVTCRTVEDDCYFCREPDWNKQSEIPANSRPFKFKAGEPRVNEGDATTCPELYCDDGYLPFYDQTDYTSIELPQCTYDKATDRSHWTITVAHLDYWDRIRVHLTKGFCVKKTACTPLPKYVLRCPETLPGFDGCTAPEYMKGSKTEPAMYTCGSSEDDDLVLYAAPKYRDWLDPVESVTCDATTGEFKAKVENGRDASWSFSDDSWLVCIKRRYSAPVDVFTTRQRPPAIRALMGGALGFLVYLVVIGILFLLRTPIHRLMDFIYVARAARAEMKALEKEEQARKAAEAEAPAVEAEQPPPDEDPFNRVARNPFLRRTSFGSLHPSGPPIAPSSGGVSVTETQGASKTSEKREKLEEYTVTQGASKTSDKREKLEENTCLEPDGKEMEILLKADNAKGATEEDDQTGKEVGSIHQEQEDLPKEEKAAPKDGTPKVRSKKDGTPKDGSKKESPKESPSQKDTPKEESK